MEHSYAEAIMVYNGPAMWPSSAKLATSKLQNLRSSDVQLELGYQAVDKLPKPHDKPRSTSHMSVILLLCVHASDNGWVEPGKEGSFGNSCSEVCHSIIDRFWQFGRQAAFNVCFLRSKHSTAKNCKRGTSAISGSEVV